MGDGQATALRPGVPYDRATLYARGAWRTFTGPALGEIAFPLGGIGTGTVSLGGRGQLVDWEIFNRPGKGVVLPYSFFALWARAEGEAPVARVLEARLQPPYRGGFGLPTATVSGLPRLREATFSGSYPFARVAFRDERLPVTVSLEAFNPFIPLNDRDSGLPVALFLWTLENQREVPVEATLAASLLNAAGYDGQAALQNRRHPLFGQNLNEWVAQPVGPATLMGLRMTTRKYEATDARFGSLALATPWPHVTGKLRWERAGWWDDVQSFWDDFAADGRLEGPAEPEPSPDGETDVGTLGLVVRLEPGQRVTLPVVLAWHFPNLYNYWNREEAVRGKRLGNWYATQWPDAWAVATYVAEHLERLERETRLFHETLTTSTVPAVVLDAVSSQASIMRTTTCLRTEDGRFHAFEGCHDRAGCCPMNCTHVWNYEQAVAFLFPQLERTMRETDFGHNTLPTGHMAFRTLLPLVGATWQFHPAADGQMGCVLKLYREWKLSGDTEFLRRLWPAARRALEFAWRHWDPDRDGVMEGQQHNTYDIEFYGPNPMTGAFYLGALRAAEEMARALGEEELAATYRAVFEKGWRRLDRELWNGEYYVQDPGEQASQRYQFGPGCLSDQLLGQWFAAVVGLGYLLPPERVRAALTAIFRYNWRPSLEEHASCQRTYALNDEAGLLLCTWPRGGRPPYPFPYADEVWTGIEYQVAAHLIYEGLVDEGLAIVKSVRDRYDGVKRNPWDEVECGHHYARAMSSWSLLLALSGFAYDGPAQAMGFAPRLAAAGGGLAPDGSGGEAAALDAGGSGAGAGQPGSGAFASFWSTGSAWGLYRQESLDAAGGRSRGLQVSLEVRYGQLELRRFGCGWPAAWRPSPWTAAEARLLQPGEPPQPLAVTVVPGDDGPPAVGVTAGPERLPGVVFAGPLRLQAGDRLELELEL